MGMFRACESFGTVGRSLRNPILVFSPSSDVNPYMQQIKHLQPTKGEEKVLGSEDAEFAVLCP